MRLTTVWFLCLLTAPPALAQESQLHAEFRREGERIKENCGAMSLAKIGSCAITLATDQPLHVAQGTIAPGNGFGLGLAFVTHRTPSESWRLNWSADGVGALGGAWRAGAYMKIVHTPVQAPVPTAPGGPAPSPQGGIHPYAVATIYAQAISLPTLSFYGIGPSTPRERAVFAMRETIVGASGIVPISGLGGINLSLLGEINGRLVRVRGAGADGDPSIDERFTNASAPGLGSQPGFVQFGEGVRLTPSLFNGRVQLNYLAQFQQFVAPSDSTYSFRRWTVDLKHDLSLYRQSSSPASRDANGPNECSLDPTTARCPSVSRNRTGTIGIRGLLSRSDVSAHGVVPFYFQHTLGGSDLAGSRMLASYSDYRFRGPHVIFLQATLEHSLYGPVGLWLAAEQGKVATQDGKTDFKGLRHSIGAGLTLRAGGFPALLVSWATGGTEGHRIAATMSTSLLGGSARPSLY